MRFELSEGKSNKFWEIDLEGARFVVRFGRIGAAGQRQEKRFATPAAAKKAHDALVAEKTKKGYRAVDGATPSIASSPTGPVRARDEALERAILADLSRDEPFLVYADWLQAQGDARGELAALQGAGKAHERQAQALLWKHREHFYGPLARYLSPTPGEGPVRATWRHGWMDSLRLAAESGWSRTKRVKGKGKRPPVVLFTLGHPLFAEQFAKLKLPPRFRSMPAYIYPATHHRQVKLFTRLKEEKLPKKQTDAAHEAMGGVERFAAYSLGLKTGQSYYPGFHASASFDEVARSFEEDGFVVRSLEDAYEFAPDVKEVPTLVHLLHGVDSARFLRSLTIGCATYASTLHFGDTIKALVQVAPHLQTLERLFIGDFDYSECEISWSELGNAQPLLKALPKLRALKLRAGKMALGTVDHAHLEDLELETGGLARETLRSVTNASLPRLTRLSLWFGEANYGGTCRLEDIEALLGSPVVKQVRHLGLKNCELGDEVVALLAKSKVLRQLETLDVSKSHLTETGAKTIADNAKAFAHLAKLDVSDGLLSKAGEKLLGRAAKEVVIGKQDPKWWGLAEGYRYAALGE